MANSRSIADILSLTSLGKLRDFPMMCILTNTADSSAIASSASENNFSVNRVIVPPMWKAGGILRVRIGGVYSTTGTPTLTLRLKLGSTNILVFGAKAGINNASNQSWLVLADIICRTLGSSGTVMAQGSVFFNDAANRDTLETVVNSSTTTISTLANQTLQLSAQWSASSSSNTTTLKNFVLEVINY